MADDDEDTPPQRLSDDQEMALGCLTNTGDNIFLTGCAGAGKSHVLNSAIELLQKRYSMRGVIVTASTGVAAAHIGGITLHSFAGVGVEKITAKAAVAEMGWQVRFGEHSRPRPRDSSVPYCPVGGRPSTRGRTPKCSSSTRSACCTAGS